MLFDTGSRIKAQIFFAPPPLKLAFNGRKRYIYTDKDNATQWKLTSK